MFRLFPPPRHFLWFEWLVTESCNLNCYYCVNQKAAPGKPKEKSNYTPTYVAGREVEIAARIAEVSKYYN